METTGLGSKISSNCWSASVSAIQPTSTVVATLLLSFLECSHFLPCGSRAIMAAQSWPSTLVRLYIGFALFPTQFHDHVFSEH